MLPFLVELGIRHFRFPKFGFRIRVPLSKAVKPPHGRHGGVAGGLCPLQWRLIFNGGFFFFFFITLKPRVE